MSSDVAGLRSLEETRMTAMPSGGAGVVSSHGHDLPEECLLTLADFLNNPCLGGVNKSFHRHIEMTVAQFLTLQREGKATPRSSSISLQRISDHMEEDRSLRSSFAKIGSIYRQMLTSLPEAVVSQLHASTQRDLSRLIAAGKKRDEFDLAEDQIKIGGALEQEGLPEEIWNEEDLLTRARRIREWMDLSLAEDPAFFDDVNLLDMSLEELYSLRGFTGLRALTNLWLHDNSIRTFQGMPPMPRLEGLWMDRNVIGSFEGLPECPLLEELSLEQNKIRSMLGLPLLPALNSLNLTKNKIRSLAGMPEFPNLQDLYLDQNEVGDLKGMPSLPRLQLFDLSRNQICSFEGFADLPQLRILKANHNLIPSFTGMSPCPHLEELHLANNRMESFADMPEMPHLRQFWMQQNRIRTLVNMPIFPELEALYLAHNKVSSLPAFLVELPHLQTLSLYGNPILHVAPEILASERAVFAENPIIIAFKDERETEVETPLGKLYRAILFDRPFEELQALFTDLPLGDKNLIDECVWKEATGPNEPGWGGNHRFDSQDVFERAVRNSILTKLERLSLEQKTEAYCRIATLSGMAPDPDYGEMYAHKNQALLAEALSIF